MEDAARVDVGAAVPERTDGTQRIGQRRLQPLHLLERLRVVSLRGLELAEAVQAEADVMDDGGLGGRVARLLADRERVREQVERVIEALVFDHLFSLADHSVLQALELRRFDIGANLRVVHSNLVKQLLGDTRDAQALLPLLLLLADSHSGRRVRQCGGLHVLLVHVVGERFGRRRPFSLLHTMPPQVGFLGTPFAGEAGHAAGRRGWH